jgi:hypothetical protein
MSRLLTFLAIALVIAKVSATTALPQDLHSLVSRCGVAFAGTVSGKSVEQLETTIVTHVDFTGVVFAKGGPKKGKARLTLAGGKVGKRTVLSPGLPKFEVGRRYVVLAYEDWGSKQNSYLPIVGLFQGYFRVESDFHHGTPIVFDFAGRQVVRIEKHRLVVTRSSARPESSLVGLAMDSLAASGPESQDSRDRDEILLLRTEEDPGTRMSEEEFLAGIRRLAKEP